MVSIYVTNLAILIAAAILDYLLGDPWDWFHPVQAIGWFIRHYTDTALKYLAQPWQRKLAGVGLGAIAIVGTGLISWVIVALGVLIHPWLGMGLQVVMLASCFAGKSLRRAAIEVVDAISPDSLALAREKLSFYVGRDTDKLTKVEIYRAILETITENATDGVMAPLFYAIAGSFIPAVGAVPLAMAYKAASTLDSMVGYKREPYTDIGWFSAKSEDIFTWLPCRLTVLTVSILSGKPLIVWRTCLRDAVKDPSPNSGWSECAYAAALGVQVGGINYYRGEVKKKPLLGEDLQPITPNIIDRALNLTRYSFILWLTWAATAIGILTSLGK
jgi:adenosylcobinamide-phosphate synthase